MHDPKSGKLFVRNLTNKDVKVSKIFNPFDLNNKFPILEIAKNIRPSEQVLLMQYVPNNLIITSLMAEVMTSDKKITVAANLFPLPDNGVAFKIEHTPTSK